MTQKLIEATRALLSSLDSTLLRPFLDEWPAGTAQAVVPASLPVLTWLPQVQRDAEPFAAELVSEICRAAPSMSWQQTYRAAVDEHFLRFMQEHPPGIGRAPGIREMSELYASLLKSKAQAQPALVTP